MLLVLKCLVVKYESQKSHASCMHVCHQKRTEYLTQFTYIRSIYVAVADIPTTE